MTNRTDSMVNRARTYFRGGANYVGHQYRQVRRMANDPMSSLQRSLPLVRSLASPLTAHSTGRHRSQAAKGLQAIFNTKTASGASGILYGLQQRHGDFTRTRKLEMLAKQAYGQVQNKGQVSARLTDSITNELRALGGKGQTLSTAANSVKKEFFSKRGMVKSLLAGKASSALTNPRNYVIAGLGIAASRSMSKFAKYGDQYYTESMGAGKYGTDSSGMLGPASLQGMRFQTIRRSKLI